MESTSYALRTVQNVIAGAGFGAALTLARVYLPGVIFDQMRLRDFHMLEVFLSATTFSALVFLLLEKLSLAKRVTRPYSTLGFSLYDGNILGGSLIGLGMATAGACPGTVIIQFAQGIPIARITLLGAVLGGTTWVFTYDRIGRSSEVEQSKTPLLEKPEASPSDQSRITIPEVLNISTTKVYLAFILLLSTITATSVFYFPGKSQAFIPTVLAGALVALSQATSLLVAGFPLGTSGAYEQIGRYIVRALSVVGIKQRDVPLFPTQIVFAGGMALGSLLISHFETVVISVLRNLPVFRSLPVSSMSLDASTGANISPLQALLGGFVLSYGARMAGGCTSGHGITGLSSLSWASLISVMSMFGGGILARLVMDQLAL